MEVPKLWQSLTARPVAILGDGISGKWTQKLLEKTGWEHEVFDEKGKHLPKEPRILKKFGLVIFSPGFPPYHEWLKRIFRAKINWVNTTDFAATFWPGPIVAVTGTNGKTSLTESLTAALIEAGESACAVENNGCPLAKILYEEKIDKNSTAVCEISSFQAWGLKYFSPNHVLWTNFDKDHLNFHRNASSYFRAKRKLILLAKKGKNVDKFWTTKSVIDKFNEFGYELPECIKEVKLEKSLCGNFLSKGQVENFSILKSFWADTGRAKEVVEKIIQKFQPLPHRLNKVAKIGKANFWNDSKATNLHAMKNAFSSFENPIVWIGGGALKGEQLHDYVKFLEGIKSLQAAILIGESGRLLYDLLELKEQYYFPSLQEAVKFSMRYTDKRLEVLFSPGFASFDCFKNFSERGNLFKNYVLGLKTIH